MKSYEVIDISGDAGIRAYGSTLQELFRHAAEGMYSLITDPAGLREQRDILVEAGGNSLEGLLVSWLNELIFHFDTYGFIGKNIRHVGITPDPSLSPSGGSGQTARSKTETPAYMLKGVVSGEDFDPERHEKRLLIKAATYHLLNVEQKDGQWVADVIFDI